MKLTLIAALGAIAVLSLSARAEDMPGMKMDGMAGMQMKQEAKQAAVAKAEGTIKAINTAKPTVTISHGAVPAVQWPAMTMAFSATADQLTGLSVGDRVAFEFQIEGAKTTIVAIEQLK